MPNHHQSTETTSIQQSVDTLECLPLIWTTKIRLVIAPAKPVPVP
jgi:hypothetical protein